LDEQTLIAQLRQGNEPVFRLLVESHSNRLYSSVLNILQDSREAEDAVQETFIQVFESIKDFKGESTLTTWIYRIAIRKALEKQRRKKAKKRLQSLLPWWMPAEEKGNPIFQHPGIAVENKEKAGILFKAIDALPQNQKLAFTLIKVQGMSYEEVCQILQIGVKAAESLVSRAKANLQKSLEAYYKTLK
jgi:RNA polymerase sigma factor (sigma-70 family)